ncbi:hypothetical protein A5791_16405 [Mycobacterium sp. 852002-51163_SCH5372311]|uniref:CsbD family protein n=1 Tax=Mycobacterium sp. 852002-51163_SCH5372311 TaxID=1834097 RepID=UPI0007FDCEB3|nr:hypothetical protein A5791_16405 [Mycobacterium sp. 852002-51163_SCH5372311]
MSIENKLRNKAQYWGGRARQTVGRVTGNRRTEYEGQRDQVKANLKDAGEKVRDAFRSLLPGRRARVQDRPLRGNQRPYQPRNRRSRGIP